MISRNKSKKSRRSNNIVRGRRMAFCSYLLMATPAILALIPEQAEAAFIYEIAGDVIGSNELFPLINIGDPFSVSVGFDIIESQGSPADINFTFGSLTLNEETVTFATGFFSAVNDSTAFPAGDGVSINLNPSFLVPFAGGLFANLGILLEDTSGVTLSSDNFLDALAASSSFPTALVGAADAATSETLFDGVLTNFSLTELEVAPVPLPPAFALFGAGLIGLLGLARTSRNKEKYEISKNCTHNVKVIAG